MLRELSSSEARHLFTALRKAANHPLLLRFRYSDDEILNKIASTAHKHGHFGPYCDYQRVRAEIEKMSDFDIHRICLDYPNQLLEFILQGDVLYDSPKFVALREMVPALIADGHRILIFSQWTRLLDLLELLMVDIGIFYLRLDGSTAVRERQVLIDEFNANTEIPVFLLSTKAGGLGINLTAADTVIMHDLDFNPENDKQAQDRCHRIGQQKQVTVYKLVCTDSVDEDIFNMGERKSKLSSAILHNSNSETAKGSGKKKATTEKKNDIEVEIKEDEEEEDIGAIGWILQKALLRVQNR